MKITTDLMYARDDRGDRPKMVWFVECSLCGKVSDPAWSEENLAGLITGWESTDTQDKCPDCQF